MSAIHQPIVSSAHTTDIACLSSVEDELVAFIYSCPKQMRIGQKSLY